LAGQARQLEQNIRAIRSRMSEITTGQARGGAGGSAGAAAAVAAAPPAAGMAMFVALDL